MAATENKLYYLGNTTHFVEFVNLHGGGECHMMFLSVSVSHLQVLHAHHLHVCVCWAVCRHAHPCGSLAAASHCATYCLQMTVNKAAKCSSSSKKLYILLPMLLHKCVAHSSLSNHLLSQLNLFS